MLTGNVHDDGFYLAPAVGYSGVSITDYGPFGLSGSMDSPEARITAGYQVVGASGFKFTGGLGVRMVGAGDIVISDSSGREVLRANPGAIGALAVDLRLGYMF